MEITAAYQAVVTITEPLEVVSDSTYVVNCFRDKWWEGWIRRGWKNAQRQPVANRELWEPFIEVVRSRDDVTFRWVKGHSGDPMNDLVDRLAVEAAATQRQRSGDEPPDPPARPDRVPFAERPPTLPGHPVAVLGHRPTELGGYDADMAQRIIASQLRAELTLVVEEHPDLAIVSGLRLGAEMLGAEVAVEAGYPLVVVLPYPDPESVWPPASQERFRVLRDRAVDVVLLQKSPPASKKAAGEALARRDAWIARHVSGAVLVWDGEDPTLARLARSLRDHLGGDLEIVDPVPLLAAADRGARP